MLTHSCACICCATLPSLGMYVCTYVCMYCMYGPMQIHVCVYKRTYVPHFTHILKPVHSFLTPRTTLHSFLTPRTTLHSFLTPRTTLHSLFTPLLSVHVCTSWSYGDRGRAQGEWWYLHVLPTHQLCCELPPCFHSHCAETISSWFTGTVRRRVTWNTIIRLYCQCPAIRLCQGAVWIPHFCWKATVYSNIHYYYSALA